MIKANEIRLGNYFFDADGNEKQIDYSDLVALQITSLHFSPIPLTPERLERCQLEYLSDPINGYELTKHICIVKNATGYSLCVIETSVNGGEYVSEIRRIDYLHELQNITLDLTGEELEIKKLT